MPLKISDGTFIKALLLLLLFLSPCAAQSANDGAPFLIWDEKGKYGYMDRSGKYVLAQPHGQGVIKPRWWRENYRPSN